MVSVPRKLKVQEERCKNNVVGEQVLRVGSAGCPASAKISVGQGGGKSCWCVWVW